MSKSDIVFNMQYKIPKNKKVGITKWIGYASQKHKADSSKINNYDVINDYSMYMNMEQHLNENEEIFLWNSKGNITNKEALLNINNMNESGMFWRGFLSFPTDFAKEHGLITKTDYYNLTNNIMPSLLIDMGFDLNNAEYLCTLHRDTENHPHVHFCIYEKVPIKTNPRYDKSVIYKTKSNIGNYLVDNTKFYKLRDESFSNILGSIKDKELNKLNSHTLFSDKYRKELNNKLLKLYKELPPKGRLQYNSKNISMFKKELDEIIEFILLHDTLKYQYSKYIKLLKQHQKELNQLYGTSKSIDNNQYYNEQVNRLYAKIGNEILDNYKKFQTQDIMEYELKFLKNHIKELNFKSRSDYAKNETKIAIAKELYKICVLSDLNINETKKVINSWLVKSKYSFNIDDLMILVSKEEVSMSSAELYTSLNKLGYNYERYKKVKDKNFYKELNYKKIINNANNFLKSELDKEEKEITYKLECELLGEDKYY